MSSLDFEIKNKIISYLRDEQQAASASEIAKQINHNRITVGKYLQILEAQKLVTSKKIASGIFWQLVDSHIKPSILIADDEKHIVDLIRLSISSSGYKIYEAYDGEEALRMARSLHPDVIILDIMMPKKDGFEVCKYIKSDFLTQDILVVVVSAKGEVKDKISMMELGADDYLVKPFDPLELEARVSNLLRKKQSQNLRNPLTQLPNSAVTQENRVLWSSKKKKWFELKIDVLHYDVFAEKFGHKRAIETLKLIVKTVIDQIRGVNKDFFIGHLSDTSLVIFSLTPLNSLSVQIKKRFTQLLPFFYPDSKGTKNTSLLDIELVEEKHG